MKYSSLLLWLSVVGLGLTSSYLFRQLAAERNRAEAYRLSLQELRGEAPSVDPNGARAVASEHDNISAGMDNKPTSNPSSGGGSAEPNPVTVLQDTRRKVEEDQARQFLQYETRRSGVLMAYGDLMEQLKLSDSQVEAFVEIMVELRERQANSDAQVLDKSEYSNKLSSMRAEINSKIISQLGESGFAAYNEYQQTLSSRGVVSGLNMMSTAVGAPLDREQRERLLAIMLEERRVATTRVGVGAVSEADRRIEFEDRVRARAAAILNEAQLRQFDVLRVRTLSAINAQRAPSQ